MRLSRLPVRLLQSRSGNFAIITALAAVPIFGAAGLAVDYMSASRVRSMIQNDADRIALALAAGGQEATDASFLSRAAAAFPDEVKAYANVATAELSGRWLTESDIEITVRSTMPTILAGLLSRSSMEVSTRAIARYNGPSLSYKFPKVAQLDPEAHDYNQISVYCFDVTQKDNPAANYGRGEPIAIADNAGGVYDYPDDTIDCAPGEVLSTKLWNVRKGRINNTRKGEQYEHYSDTQLSDQGVESYDFGGKALIESLVCDTFEKCVGQSKGGIIPEGKNRTPVLTDKTCPTGSYRYYGYEDRPPQASGGSDRDYDDIRIIIDCPALIENGDKSVVLVL
jgi:hypothetical protein